MEQQAVDVRRMITSLPGSNVLVLPDSPVFTIAAVSDGYLKDTGRTRDELLGKGLFEVFPNNPVDPYKTSEKIVRASLEYALLHKDEHHLPVQRYDIPTASNSFTERYWSAYNKPLLSEAGEVLYLIHNITDVSQQLKAQQHQAHLKSIQKAYDLFMQAPVIIGILKGDDYIIELANEGILQLWGKRSEIIGKPLLQALPELQEQGFIQLLDRVRTTGEPYYAYDSPVTLARNGQQEVRYLNFVYQPFYDDGETLAAGVFAVAHDVTEKVIAERAMEEANREAERQKRLYEAINGSTPDLIYVFDLNYRFTYANKALLTMWGRTWEQSKGRGLLELGYEPWHAAMHEREIDQVAATKQSIRGEVSFPHATLGKRMYDYIFVPVLNDRGEVEAVAGTTRDITDIKLAEQTIRESNERFRNLADDSPMFVFIIDLGPNAPVSYWNKTWLQYTGQTLEEAQDRAWNGIIHLDDVPVVAAQYTPAFQNKEAYFIPAVRVKRHDGQYRWHAFKGNPRYDATGAFMGYIGVGFDIHEQKQAEEALRQSEERLRKILSIDTVGVIYFDLDDTIKEANAAFQHMSGFMHEDFKNRRICWDNITPPEFMEVTLRSKEELQVKGENTPYEKQYIRPDGTRWWGLFAGKRLSENEYVEFVVDISKVKQAEEELERKVQERTADLELANLELKRSNVNLEEFAYAASHDLKEPVRKMHFFSDRLKQQLTGLLNEEQSRMFGRMENATQRMGLLIDDLLAYSQVSRGASTFETVTLNQTVKNVLEDLELEIEQKQAKVFIDPLPEIEGSKRQLQQLFQNLISNALKYGKPGVPPEIYISASPVIGRDTELHLKGEQGDKQYHLVAVKDNGIGFQQQDAERIFNVFTRLHGNAEYRGTGVGLSIARKVVENHQGYVWAESQPGEGSSFYVLLPVM